jgi:hypothetical protein
MNASSLKRLPAVLRDLSAAMNESTFQSAGLFGENGLSIHLYDVTCKSFERAAAIRYQANDTVYHLKLNRLNKQAADKALATTLIHEIMHCVLLNLDTKAKHLDGQAISRILDFGLNRNDTSNFFNNQFFVQMNIGEEGQHELMYELFYPQMVSVLERFAEIHNEPFWDRKDVESLMWSGLQGTNAYKKLNDEEKHNIELAILRAKGLKIDIEED